jgi:hypothetical protein
MRGLGYADMRLSFCGNILEAIFQMGAGRRRRNYNTGANLDFNTPGAVDLFAPDGSAKK